MLIHRLSAVVFALGLSLLVQGTNGAILLNQVDDFQDGSIMNWLEGGPSPNPPINVASGGPAGANDRYLYNESSGGGGPGSRQIMFNSSQWAGNYLAAGVTRITADMANFGSGGDSVLEMRLVLTSSNNVAYISNNPVTLALDGGIWHSVSFDLTDTTMSLLTGSDTLADVLADVSEMRIISSSFGGSRNGDPVVSKVGLDNLHATLIPEPLSLALFPVIGFIQLYRRKRSAI